MATKTKRILTIATLVVAVGGFAAALYLPWKRNVLRDRRADLVSEARIAVTMDEPMNALAHVDRLRSLPGALPGDSMDADVLETAAAAKARDFGRLLRLQESTPEVVLAHEEASYWMARLMAGIGNGPTAEKLIAAWKNQPGNHPDWWLFLEADQLLARGATEEAAALLESERFARRAEAGRQLRLALARYRDAAACQQHLDAAYAADPTHPETRLFRARLLEASGQAGRARVEHAAALAASPGDVLIAHEYARFCQRQGLFAEAVRVWDGLGGDTRLDFAALPALFWKNVALAPSDTIDSRLVRGPAAPLIAALEQIQRGPFPTPEWFRKFPVAENRPETWWLGLFGLLQQNRNPEALDHLEAAPAAARSWNPVLADALAVLLRWEIRQVAPRQGDLASVPPDHPSPILRSLAEWSRQGGPADRAPPALARDFLAAPMRVPSLLAAAGWGEAAVRLLPEGEPLPPAPLEHAYALAVTLRHHRGCSEVLARWPIDCALPAMKVLNAECLLLGGQKELAVGKLEELAQGNSEPAVKAAWLLATLALASDDLAKATDLLARYPALAAHPLGKSIAARVAIARGAFEDADQIYAAMDDPGEEGLAWMARRAYEAKRLDEAESLTLRLLEIHPGNLTLLKNLQRIREGRTQ